MKLDPAISAKLAGLQPNQIGMLAWTLLAHPPVHMHLGGVPHQPDPDPSPSEPGEPTIPDQPPPPVTA